MKRVNLGLSNGYWMRPPTYVLFRGICILLSIAPYIAFCRSPSSRVWPLSLVNRTQGRQWGPLDKLKNSWYWKWCNIRAFINRCAGGGKVFELRHLPLVPLICVSESGQHWFIKWQWLLTNFNAIFIQIKNFLFTKMHKSMEMVAIFSRGR